MSTLFTFLAESNAIEGILRGPSVAEETATRKFLWLMKLDVPELQELQAVFAPGKPLRDKLGMNVQVGNYVAPSGGPLVVRRLEGVLVQANAGDDPWVVHCAYEMLHPFMDGNGRTGRIVWAWQMLRLKCDPFALPFLHRFYYQTLENSA